MKKRIVVAGATGNLGLKIIKALVQQGAEVRALVRPGTEPEKLTQLALPGVTTVPVNLLNKAEVTAVCQGATCVVSALSGLREVIINVQMVLLDAAISAGVPRFIPSDYSLDFTRFQPGGNRNLDVRREFHTYLDSTPIATTSIFNGAFADLLTQDMPLILFKQKLILYWGQANHRLWFTTMDDTAAFTAQSALDDASPRYLHIAGDQKSPRELKDLMTQLTGHKYRLLRAGSPGMLRLFTKITQTLAPGKNELYPAWQGMQYMHNMIDECANLTQTDNNRYPGITFTSIGEVIKNHLKKQQLN